MLRRIGILQPLTGRYAHSLHLQQRMTLVGSVRNISQTFPTQRRIREPAYPPRQSPAIAAERNGAELCLPHLFGGATDRLVARYVDPFSKQGAIDSAPQDSAEERCHPEKPQLAQRPATREYGRACAPRRVHGSIGNRNTYQVNESQAQADCDGGKSLGGSAIGRAENDQQKESRKHNLGQKAGNQCVSPGRVRSVPIAGKSSARVKTCLSPGNDVQNPGPSKPAGDLSGDVGKKVGRSEASPRKQSDGNCWIQMTAGNVSDGVSHG